MVTGFLKLLENKHKSSLDETALKYIYYAVDGADRMKILINDLLEYSKVSSSKELTSDTDMNEIVAEVLRVFALKITEQHAIVTVGKLPLLAGTLTSRLFQLMQNLIGNALKVICVNPIHQIPTNKKVIFNGNGLFGINITRPKPINCNSTLPM